ncbi:hypothetical protein [Flavobacterium sp.]|uniref:hypothetical protein n=1 Tax=Flavobacterium sp. TaxID=239 RepID=UPI003D0FF6EC
MKKIVLLLLTVISFQGFAQSLNDYKTVLIPAKFSFQKEENQYRINATVKMYLKQKGFDAYLSSDKLPEGFMEYNCNKLYVNAITEGNMFSTRIKFEFKDCKGNVLFTTDLGESREKEYATAYNLATIEAIKTFDKANYKYNGRDFDEEIIQAKLKEMNREVVTETKVVTEKTELFYKVTDKLSGENMILYKTSNPSVFLTTFKNRSGMVVRKDTTWFFEFIDGEKVSAEKIDVNF